MTIPKLGKPSERHADIYQFAYQLFHDLNAQSINVNREFCGYFYRDNHGQLMATKPAKGGTHSCLSQPPDGQVRVIASYHTHAAYDFSSFNEYPSDVDMEGDFDSRLHGYISTPGGRLWFVDFESRMARQLCGYRCLPFDRRYREARADRPKKSVTLGYIKKILSEYSSD